MPFCRGVYLCIDYCNYCSAAQNNLTIIALGHNGAHVLIILTSRMTLDIRFAVHCPGCCYNIICTAGRVVCSGVVSVLPNQC